MAQPNHAGHLLIALGVPQGKPKSGMPPSSRGSFGGSSPSPADDMGMESEPDADDMNGGGDVDQAAIKGEPGTGFEKNNGKGPFECGNCSYFKAPGSCHQDDMKQKSSEPRNQDGSVQVANNDCCEFVDRVGTGSPAGAGMPPGAGRPPVGGPPPAAAPPRPGLTP